MTIDTKEARALVVRLTGFTKGPWCVDISDPTDVVVWDDDDNLIANIGQCIQPVYIAFDCDPLDARLIAAAPDLHAALTAALDEVERLRGAAQHRKMVNQ